MESYFEGLQRVADDQYCETCRYLHNNSNESPCDSCRDFDKWERVAEYPADEYPGAI